MAQTRFYRSRSLRQGQRSNQGHIMTLHSYNPLPMSLLSINFLHLTVPNILTGQDFKGQVLLRYNSLPCGTECLLGRLQASGQRPRKMDA